MLPGKNSGHNLFCSICSKIKLSDFIYYLYNVLIPFVELRVILSSNFVPCCDFIYVVSFVTKRYFCISR